MTFPTIVHLDGVGLFLDQEDEHTDIMLVEGGELGRFLEYTQPGSVRKQVLSDWKEHFAPGADYVIEKFAFERKEWVKRRKATDDATLLPVVHSRNGRIFLTEEGLAKFLRMTAKPRAHGLQLALAAVSHHFRAPDLEPLEDHSSSKPHDPRADSRTARAPERASWPGCETCQSLINPINYANGQRFCKPECNPEYANPSSDPPSSDHMLDHPSSDPKRADDLERRRFRHEVYQQLIRNGRELRNETDLMRLALTAAEEALGHRIEGVLRFDGVRAPQPTPEVPRVPPRHIVMQVEPRPPLVFTGFGWHTMSEIGRKAGGYSAVSAGKAADIVAERVHIAPHTLRTRPTSFSRVKRVPDSSTGKLRSQVEFNSEFANHIVAELRTNPELRPKDRPDITPFGAGAENSPKLSRPVDLSDASSPGDA